MSAASRRAGARDNLDFTLTDRSPDGDVFRRQDQKAGLDRGRFLTAIASGPARSAAWFYVGQTQ